MDILSYCTYMPFWTLFLPSKLIWQLNVSVVAQVKNSACCLRAARDFFCLIVHIYTSVAHPTVYPTFLNNSFKMGIKVLFIEILLLYSFFFAAKGLGDLHALTATVSVCQDT